MSTPRNILITGASRGLGMAVVRTILANGDNVIALSRQSSPALDELIESAPDSIRHVAFDLDRCDCLTAEWFQAEIAHDQPIHGLVNNAAVAYDDLVTNLQVEPLERIFRVNVTSPMMLTKLIIRQMLLHQIGGSIVHVSSISAHTGYKGLAMYAATKGAIEAFSKNTAREWGPRKIRSNCVVPGFMETEMSASLNQEQKDRIYRRTALKEPTSIESVANTVAFLLSDKSCSMTGQNVFVDSGSI